MAPTRPDKAAFVAERLRLIRRAYSVVQRHSPPISQSEFARLCGIGIAAWNNAETGDNRIGLDNAIALRRKTGATLDFIFCDDASGLPHFLAVEIARLQERDEVELKPSASGRAA